MNQDNQLSREIPKTRAELVRAIGRETRLQQNANDAIDELFGEYLGANRTDVRVIDLLDAHGPMTAGELADRVGVTTGAVTAILDRMERAGFLRRVRDQADRRKVHVELTDDVRRVAEEFYAPIAERGTQMLSRYSVEELRTILDAVRRGREVSETFRTEMRERVPRRGLVDAVRSLREEAKALKHEAKAIKDEWTEEGRALKRELKEIVRPRSSSASTSRSSREGTRRGSPPG
jgi:DNA-binding MarR family transcriptional regulator